MKKISKLKIVSRVWICLFLAVSTGCFSSQVKPDESETTYEIKGRVACISATQNDVDYDFAVLSTSKVAAIPGLKVIPQKEIEKKVEGYPITFSHLNEYHSDRWTLSPGELSEDHIKKLSIIQKKINADYLILLWNRGIGSATGGCTGITNSNVFYYSIRIIKFPEKKVIKYYDLKEDNSSVFGLNTEGHIRKAIETASTTVAQKISALAATK